MKIKKCPFCSKRPMEDDVVYIETNDRSYYNYLHFCEGYTGQSGMTVSIHGSTKKEVLRLWNKRGNK